MTDFQHDSSFSSGDTFGINQNPQTDQESEQLKADKERIYNHPMFPLLQLIFQKCELSSNTTRDRPSGDIASSDSFNEDIAHYAKQIEEGHQKEPTLNMGDELDSIMILAIQVLRYHLLEMDKVHELCTNFTERYIDCLKGKMPIDAVIDDRESPKPEDEVENISRIQAQNQTQSQMLFPMQSAAQTQNSGLTQNNSHKQERDETSNGIQPITSHHPARTASANQGPAMLDLSNDHNQPSSGESGGGDSDTESRGGKGSSNKKRGLFPKQATNILRAWLFQNLSHPYPSEEQKKHLSTQTGLTILQVNNWFINARRRIVQPMIDQSNRAVSQHLPYDPRVMGSFSVGSLDSQQQQVAAATAMLGHGFPAASMLNPSGLPMTSSASLHGLRPEQLYSSSNPFNFTPSSAAAAHSSISPADLHMLSHC